MKLLLKDKTKEAVDRLLSNPEPPPIEGKLDLGRTYLGCRGQLGCRCHLIKDVIIVD